VVAAHESRSLASSKLTARRPPRCCAPPAVNASSTRTVGTSNADVDSCRCHWICRRVSVKNRRPIGPFSENRRMCWLDSVA
jgi:hypothetical protein